MHFYWAISSLKYMGWNIFFCRWNTSSWNWRMKRPSVEEHVAWLRHFSRPRLWPAPSLDLWVFQIQWLLRHYFFSFNRGKTDWMMCFECFRETTRLSVQEMLRTWTPLKASSMKWRNCKICTTKSLESSGKTFGTSIYYLIRRSFSQNLFRIRIYLE